MRNVFIVSAAVALFVVAQGSAFAACPPNASPSYESGNVVHCKCNAGYENRGGGCKPIPVMRAKPEPSMWPITRAECIKFQDTIRRDGLAGCRSDLYYCMIEQGSGFPAAYCAARAVLAGLSPRSAALSALTCGERLQAVYTACEPKWTACKAAVSSSYPKGMASCPSK